MFVTDDESRLSAPGLLLRAGGIFFCELQTAQNHIGRKCPHGIQSRNHLAIGFLH